MKHFTPLISVFSIICIALAYVQPTAAQVALGERHFHLEVGAITPGDENLREIADAYLFVGGGINTAVTQYLDATISASYAIMKGRIEDRDDSHWYIADHTLTSRVVRLGLIYHHNPTKKYDPYIGITLGPAHNKTKTETFRDAEPGGVESNMDLLFSVVLGVEVNSIAYFSFQPALRYSKAGDVNDIIPSVSLCLKPKGPLLIYLHANRALDQGDVAFSLGFGFKY